MAPAILENEGRSTSFAFDEVMWTVPERASAQSEASPCAVELTKLTPRNADLLRIADRCPAPQEWYDE
jgi:hypothetical protein